VPAGLPTVPQMASAEELPASLLQVPANYAQARPERVLGPLRIRSAMVLIIFVQRFLGNEKHRF
jgi:hypothetical protein